MQPFTNRKLKLHDISGRLRVILALLPVVVLGCATSPPVPATAPGVSPGTLTVLTQAWGNGRFDVVVGGAGPGNSYGRLLHGFLIARDENAKLIPGIASQWGLSKDGLTWHWKVRRGAKFQDGREITPEDAYWSLMHLYGHDATGTALDLITSGATSALVRIVDKIEMTGDTVTLTTTQPEAAMATVVSEAHNSWNAMMPKQAKFWDKQDTVDYDRNPIGAGPMRLTNYVPAERMEFERFDDYYYQPANGFPEDRRVNFKNLVLLQIPEEATRVAALRAGEADIAPISLGARQQVEAGGGRLVFGREGIHLRVLNFGCYKPQFPCFDKRVRQALVYAINKEEMRDKLFGGASVFEVKGWEYATPSSIGYSPALDPFPFDPNKARQLLADAGFPNGKSFGKLIVNTWVSPAMPFMTESAQLAASNWQRELALDVEVRVGDETILKQKSLTEEIHGQILWRDNEARVDGASILRSTYGDPKQGSRMHETPELFTLTQETLAVTGLEERQAAFNKLYLRLRDEQYEMGIGYVNIPWGVGPKVLQWRPFSQAVYPSALHTMVLK